MSAIRQLLSCLLLAALLGPGPLAQAQNVGIGTTAPTQALDVNGQVRVRGVQGDAAGRLLGLADDGTLQAQPPTFSAAAPAFVLTPPTHLSTVATSASPQKMALHPAGTIAYVLSQPSSANGLLEVYDLSVGGLPVRRGAVPTGQGVRDLAVNPAGTRVFVLCATNNTLQVFDSSAPGLPVSLGTVPTGRNPWVLAVNAAGTRLYVTSQADNRLQTYALPISGLPLSLGVVRTGDWPVAIALNPAGTRAYVLNNNSSKLQAFDLSGALPASLDSVNAAGTPLGLALNRAGTRAYVASPYNLLDVFDTSGSALARIGRAQVVLPASGVVVDPAGTRAYVLQFSRPSVRIYDLNGGGTPLSLANLDVQAAPTAFVINPAGTRAYVLNSANTLQTFDLGSGPQPLAVGAGGAAGGLGAAQLPGAGRQPVAAGAVSSNSVVQGMVGIYEVQHPALGVYRLSFTGSPLSTIDLGQAAVVATLAGVAPGSVSYRTGRGYVEVLTYAPGGVATDRGFTFSVALP